MLSEERRKLSELVGQPEIQREMPSACVGMLSVFGRQLSELAELPSVFVWTPEVFGEHPSTCRQMPYSFRQMPFAFRAPPLCTERFVDVASGMGLVKDRR
jgi:hypothetical protein